VKTVLVIGIGLGEPQHLTLQAVEALNRVDVFLVVEKGSTADELGAIRRSLCERFATSRPHRFLSLADPPRDRNSNDYKTAVDNWTAARAALYADVVRRDLADGECAGLLAWGDPAFYDSTLRVLDAMKATGDLDVHIEVIPGISSIQALAAAHRISLTGVGRPLQVTTGRRLAANGFPDDCDDVVVMLDGGAAFRHIDPTGLWIYWGANLGSERPSLVAGQLDEVAEEITVQRSLARAQRGWVMDTYLLRRRRVSQ
jgi:precorrin-6A synthase